MPEVESAGVDCRPTPVGTWREREGDGRGAAVTCAGSRVLDRGGGGRGRKERGSLPPVPRQGGARARITGPSQTPPLCGEGRRTAAARVPSNDLLPAAGGGRRPTYSGMVASNGGSRGEEGRGRSGSPMRYSHSSA